MLLYPHITGVFNYYLFFPRNRFYMFYEVIFENIFILFEVCQKISKPF